jgi:hypothetical protein
MRIEAPFGREREKEREREREREREVASRPCLGTNIN